MSDNPIFDVTILCASSTGATTRFTSAEARRYCAGVVTLVAVTDFLFYRQRPGVSVAIFGVLALAVLALNRPPVRWDAFRWAALALIALALGQSAVETGFANAVSLFALFSAAMIDMDLKSLGARFAAPVVVADCWIRSLARWLLLPAAVESAIGGDNRDTFAVRAARRMGLVLPALLLVIPFAILLAHGNALLGEVLSRFAAWLASIHLPEVSRCAFWCVTATGAMTFLAPSVRVETATRWIARGQAPRVSADSKITLWRTGLMLAAVNALFGWANTIDAVFLWIHATLPSGVSYSQFVHQGVYSLIAATVLAEVALAWMFEQDRAVAENPTVRGLAVVWIAQNLVLLASVGIRLKLYVQAYDLTVARLGVVSFLVLVAVGFGLLGWRILAGKSLRWLILSNLFAVFGLFFALQFVDLAGMTARYNTQRWLAHESAKIDVGYLERLGAPAWPSLLKLKREAGDQQIAYEAESALARAKSRATRISGWQAWQWRESEIRKEVFSK